MKAIQIISQDLFDKVRSRFQNLEMGDATGAVTIDPAEARFFDFDFVNEGNNLGRVSISLNELGALKVYYSQGITENQDDPAKKSWYSFLKEMRFFAMRRLLRFDTRDIAKTNLDKNDFQHLATTQGPKEEEMPDTMNESRWNHKSTKKTSRAVKGTTEVIVRHAHAVDEMYPGARSQRKNIKAIFIQNKDGERFKYPFVHPAGAFAMAQHVDHGGVPHDSAGKAIIRMSEQIAQLQEFQRKVNRSTLHDDATGITERAIGRLQELKAQVEALGKRHHYESWAESFQEPGAGDDIMELDAVTMEQYKQAFTQTSFQEELAGYFPLLHKIMSEANTIDLEDYVSEESEEEVEEESTIESKDAFDAFENWAEAVEQGKLADDQIEALKQAISDTQELQLGPDGQTAFQFFSQFGLDDDDLENKFKAAAELDPKTNSLEVFQLWAQENYPELLVALGISGTGAEEPAAEEPPADAAAPAPEQPAAENEEQKGMEKAMPTREGIVKEVAKIVKSFYNADNPNVGPFRGSENIALDCKKQIAEKFGDKAGDFAEGLAGQFIEKLTNEWQKKHGSVGDDGLARLKELVGNIKSKVEGIGDRGQGGRDFNKNIMPAEDKEDNWHPSKHVTDPQKKKELAPHDKDVQRGSYKDRADYLDKGGVPRSESSEMEGGKVVVWYMIDDGEWDEKGTFDDEASAYAYIKNLAAKGYDDDNFEVLSLGQHPDDDYAYTKDFGVGSNEAFSSTQPHMDPKHAKAFDEAELASTLLGNIRMIYVDARAGRNPIDYIRSLKKDEDAFLSRYADDRTRKAYKFLMDNLVDGAVTASNIIMQVAAKAHEMIGHGDIEKGVGPKVNEELAAIMRLANHKK